MESKRITILNSKLAGFSHYDGPLAWPQLQVGSQLTPVTEDNKYDPNAVALYFADYKLGYIPRENNEIIFQFLDMGWAEVFDVRISRMSREEHPERQVDISVGICRKPTAQGK